MVSSRPPMFMALRSARSLVVSCPLVRVMVMVSGALKLAWRRRAVAWLVSVTWSMA